MKLVKYSAHNCAKQKYSKTIKNIQNCFTGLWRTLTKMRLVVHISSSLNTYVMCRRYKCEHPNKKGAR